ncbi:MAG TPA: hypothetical protein VMR70_17085 [Flavisolibacter sp.]|nr:hypothetical protein [Flavisolibacter sp.]
MKTTTVSSIVKIEEEILRNFQPVNETLATDVVLAKNNLPAKRFGVVDLWKCRKQNRYSGLRIS